MDLDPASQERDELGEAIELNPEGFMRFDAAGRCTAMNRAAEHIVCRPREEWLGKTLVEVAPEALGSPFAEAFDRCRRDRVPTLIEQAYYPPHDCWYQSRFFAARAGVLLYFRDVTDHVHLHQMEAELRFRAECRDRLASILGHDLRNPLSAITCGASLLDRLGGLTDRHARAVRLIASSSLRMAGIIDTLLDATRCFHGQIPITRQMSDLAAICRQVIEETELAHPGRRIALLADGDTSGIWDRDRLAQVVSNLLGNALDYGPPAEPIEVTMHGEPASVLLRVHNGGAPIPRETMDEIFEPFRRGDQSSATKPKGLGLGLFITKMIVEAHGGTICVESAVDLGTTFIASLPRKDFTEVTL